MSNFYLYSIVAWKDTWCDFFLAWLYGHLKCAPTSDIYWRLFHLFWKIMYIQILGSGGSYTYLLIPVVPISYLSLMFLTDILSDWSVQWQGMVLKPRSALCYLLSISSVTLELLQKRFFPFIWCIYIDKGLVLLIFWSLYHSTSDWKLFVLWAWILTCTLSLESIWLCLCIYGYLYLAIYNFLWFWAHCGSSSWRAWRVELELWVCVPLSRRGLGCASGWFKSRCDSTGAQCSPTNGCLQSGPGLPCTFLYVEQVLWLYTPSFRTKLNSVINLNIQHLIVNLWGLGPGCISFWKERVGGVLRLQAWRNGSPQWWLLPTSARRPLLELRKRFVFIFVFSSVLP